MRERFRLVVGFGVVTSGLLTSCIRVETTVLPDDPTTSAPLIVFDAPIPEAPTSMKLYRLGQPRLRAQVNLLLKGDSAKALRSMKEERDTSFGALEELEKKNPRLCRVDEKSGEVERLPDFDALSADRDDRPLDRQALFAEAKRILEDPAALVPDETTKTVELGAVLQHVRVRRDARGRTAVDGRPLDKLVYAAVTRRAEGFAVDGPGSQSMLALDSSSNVQAYVSNSRPAADAGRTVAAPNPRLVRDEIRRQLLDVEPRGPVHVQQIDVVYYDGNKELLQPVYRFVAEFSEDRSRSGRTEQVVGYVPFDRLEESVPELARDLTRPPPSPITSNRQATGAPAVKVGRYVMRNDNRGWLRDAVGFRDAIEATNSSIPFEIGPIEDARSEHFTSGSRNFVDSVDIALVEAHGVPWQFATNYGWRDVVDLYRGEVPASGYGPDSGGRLRHWILHSCEVIPSPEDTGQWAEPWWPLFRGLRSVVGYRTSMYINDGAGRALGARIGAGLAVAPAWFNAVAASNLYRLNPDSFFRCRGPEAMGRPSAITACGAASATANDPGKVEPDCLDVWWIGDELVRP